MGFVSAMARTGIVACALLLGATGANATTIFDLTGGTGTRHANGTLSIPTVEGGVTFWAFDQDKRNGSWGAANLSVGYEDAGIGVWSREEEARDIGHPLAPYVDSYTSVEYLVMKLPTASAWTPISATFEFFNNQNFSIFGYNDTGDGSFLSTGAAFSGVIDFLTPIGEQPTTSGDTFQFASGLGTFEFIIFTTTTGFTDPNNDNRFFVSGFEGQASVVPVPAALPLLLSGLGGIGLLGFMRRRQTA